MLFVAIFALFSVVAGVPFRHRVGVVGGTDAVQGQFPFVVALGNSGLDKYFYEGIIFDKNWILTVAEYQYFSDPLAVIGNISLGGGTKVRIDQAIGHKDFDIITQKDDIGLMHLKNELKFSENVQPIEIGEVNDNENCTIVGWGTYNSTNFDVLQYVETTTISIDECKKLIPPDVIDVYLGPETVCTMSSKANASSGFADVGGPLVCNGKLAGIIVEKVSGYSAEYPDVYLRVSSYVDWIQTHMVTTTSTTVTTETTTGTTEHKTTISKGSITVPLFCTVFLNLQMKIKF